MNQERHERHERQGPDANLWMYASAEVHVSGDAAYPTWEGHGNVHVHRHYGVLKQGSPGACGPQTTGMLLREHAPAQHRDGWNAPGVNMQGMRVGSASNAGGGAMYFNDGMCGGGASVNGMGSGSMQDIRMNRNVGARHMRSQGGVPQSGEDAGLRHGYGYGSFNGDMHGEGLVGSVLQEHGHGMMPSMPHMQQYGYDHASSMDAMQQYAYDHVRCNSAVHNPEEHNLRSPNVARAQQQKHKNGVYDALRADGGVMRTPEHTRPHAHAHDGTWTARTSDCMQVMELDVDTLRAELKGRGVSENDVINAMFAVPRSNNNSSSSSSMPFGDDSSRFDPGVSRQGVCRSLLFNGSPWSTP